VYAELRQAATEAKSRIVGDRETGMGPFDEFRMPRDPGGISDQVKEFRELVGFC
jgi:hypothetical protein